MNEVKDALTTHAKESSCSAQAFTFGDESRSERPPEGTTSSVQPGEQAPEVSQRRLAAPLHRDPEPRVTSTSVPVDLLEVFGQGSLLLGVLLERVAESIDRVHDLIILGLDALSHGQ
jgi:hypothetical protein